MRKMIAALALTLGASMVGAPVVAAEATPGVVIGKHGVLLRSSLPTCAYEDGSGGPRPCQWIGTEDGNGRGLSYIVHRDSSVRYVWSSDPRGNGFRWLTRSEAKRLPGTIHCVVRFGDTTRVKCPNGRHFAS